MQQRYYDPQVGSFLSVDPVQTNPNTGASFNRYSYASKNPYKFVDPDGRSDVNYNHTSDYFFDSTNRFDIPGMTTVTGHAWVNAFQDNRETRKHGPAVLYETLKQDISKVRGPGGDKGYIYLGGCTLGMGFVPARIARDFDTKVISSPGFIKQHVDADGNITFYSNSRGDGTGTASWFQVTDQQGNTYGKITSITMSSDGKVTFNRNSSSVGSSVKQKAKSMSERNGQ